MAAGIDAEPCDIRPDQISNSQEYFVQTLRQETSNIL
jgi:hypothetical protein